DWRLLTAPSNPCRSATSRSACASWQAYGNTPPRARGLDLAPVPARLLTTPSARAARPPRGELGYLRPSTRCATRDHGALEQQFQLSPALDQWRGLSSTGRLPFSCATPQ